jgi:lipopolysaccharide transport system permease protein
MNTLADLSRSRDLLVNLTLRELRGKYKRSVLGWSWSLLNPLATMIIFSLVFGLLLKVPFTVGDPSGLHNYPAFLLCGLLAWNFVSNIMNSSMLALLGNAGLIKKVFFPREVLVFATVAALGWSFIIEIAVLAVYLMILGNMVLPWLFGVIVLMVLLTMFATGIGLIVSVLNVYFRDLQYLIGIFLQLWFYATPIIYSVERVPWIYHVGQYAIPARTIYSINPMVGFVGAFRALLYDLRFPAWSQLGYITVWSVALLAIGFAVFRKFEPRLAEEL